jgi:putative endonuclease
VETPRSRLGRSGEIAAAAELGRLGYRIIDSNYRTKRGELDLIAYDRDSIVFVEVRSRRSASFCTPAESVTWRKRRRMAAAAEEYLIEKGISDTPCRFDVVEIDAGGPRPVVTQVIRDAFGTED